EATWRAVRDGGGRAGIEAMGKRMVAEPARHSQHVGPIRVLEPIAFQRAEIVCVADLASQLLEDRPVPIARGRAICPREMVAQVGLHAIIVEERVVHVEQEDDCRRRAHRAVVLRLPRSCLTISVTRSGSKPNFRCSSLSGAEAPKVFMPMMRPDGPTYRSQPRVDACSTATRAVTSGGSTLS